jgi:hypothetical protein
MQGEVVGCARKQSDNFMQILTYMAYRHSSERRKLLTCVAATAVKGICKRFCLPRSLYTGTGL